MRGILSLGRERRRWPAVVAGLLGLAGAAGCGGGGDDEGADDRPTVVVTTNVLGDVVGEVTGDAFDVEVIMPLGSDPHEFAPSTRQAEAMAEADLLVVNGAGFEEGLGDLIEDVEGSGTETFAFADHVELLDGDPHLWTDPVRMASAVGALGERLGEIEGADIAELQRRTDEYIASLEQLDTDIEELVAGIPSDRRTLVTNHEVFAYFADRYGFDVLGAVIPSSSTNAQASSGDLSELAETVRDAGVLAIFAETTQSTQLAEALADEAGQDVAVVELFTESLDETGTGAETYLDMMRTNAELIAEGLGAPS